MPSTDQIDSTSLQILERMCVSSGTQYATRYWKMVSDCGLKEASRLKFDHTAYSESRQFALDYAVSRFLKKYEGMRSDMFKADCWDTYQRVDWKLRLVNRKFRSGVLFGDINPVLFRARWKIRQILGDLDRGAVFNLSEWGPGATASLKSTEAALDNKLLEPKLSVTLKARRYATAVLENDLHWLRARGIPCEGPISLVATVTSEFQIVDGGRFDSVPKDWSKDRPIDVQPTMNLYLQKGIGLYLRRRLARFGIDLNDQSRNQWLASIAHKAGLATVDLSNASDSVSRELVRFLLPRDWYQVLDDVRTHMIKSPSGDFISFEKFSSMGNGFTFELESIIFYALSWACSEQFAENNADFDVRTAVISVYGDDIIIDRKLIPLLYAVFEQVGFEVNKEKSYVTGSFFESCGRHYFNGEDVTPPHQKERVKSPSSGCRCANRLLRWALRLGGGTSLEPKCYPTWRQAISKVTFDTRRAGLPVLYQPFWAEGDQGLLDPLHEPQKDLNGFLRYRGWAAVGRQRKGSDEALLAVSLRRGCVVESPFNGKVSLRESDPRYRISWFKYWDNGASVPTYN